MEQAVKEQTPGQSEAKVSTQISERARENFARLEQAREAEREARIRAEEQAIAMRRELDLIKQMSQPREKDPLDDLQDIVELDPAKLKASLARRDVAMEKRAREIATEIYASQKADESKRNFQERLRDRYSDYDSVMNESNLTKLEQMDPVFLETVLEIPDDFKRREKTYKYVKNMMNKSTDASEKTIKDVVAENQMNPYHIPSGSGMPSGVDFDVRSVTARQSAYEKLKAAQRKPIGSGVTATRR